MFLWNQPASRGQRRFAIAAVGVSTLLFLAVAPFANVRLAPVPAFIAIYESALVISDLITAIFLLGQFHFSRSRAVLLLACSYLFTACMAAAHALSFPGLFSPTGLLGAGPQTTAWLYMFWHGGFPLLVVAYAFCGNQTESRVGRAILSAVGMVLVAACGLTLAATLGHDKLPPIMVGNRYTPAMIVVVSSTWVLSVLALWALLRRRCEAVLDVWLVVVVCAWVFDIALSAVLNAGRYDLGFYAGRVYGLVATGFVLVMLLLEHSKLYIHIIQLRESERRKADELRELSVVDALTGIANRRAFEEAFDQEWRRMMRHGSALSVIMIDVDHFKRYNDTYGHVAGDQCLRAVAQVLAMRARRAGEMVARYGGEEFVVLLPHTEIDEAHRLAELMCEVVREQRIPHAGSEAAPYVTISAGVASTARTAGPLGALSRESASSAGGARLAPTDLLQAADSTLYQAKKAGRNRAAAARSDNVVQLAAHQAA